MTHSVHFGHVQMFSGWKAGAAVTALLLMFRVFLRLLVKSLFVSSLSHCFVFVSAFDLRCVPLW